MPERRIVNVAELPHPDRRVHAEPHKHAEPHSHAAPTMLELLTFINHQIGQMRVELTDHMRDEADVLANSVAEMMKEAFPGGDPAGHRRHHEAVIKQAEAKAEFWQDMAKSTARWGIIGFLGFLGYAAWMAFLRGPQ